ncbi:MAG: hypothetical protein HFJ30_09670, partial [Clostridia bacterium]|nr:hypothetical protein [Clostridia bacterium]MCI9413384.1 hypothetical protein [Clostridia bacterium]
KVERSTETNKVGFSITTTKDYTLQLTKLQKDTTKTISGVRYKITGPGIREEGINYTTDEQGKLTIHNLCPEEIYTLEETYATENYIKAEEPIQLETYFEDGNLKARIIRGTIKGEPLVENAGASSASIKIEVENVPNYTLHLTKYKKGTQDIIGKARFNIKGKGFVKNGKIIETSSQGKASVTGLYPNEIYTVQEISVPSDYILDNTLIQFKAVETNGQLSVEMISGIFKTTPTINNETRAIEVEIENEPKYELEIVKYKKGTQDTIANVSFNLKGEGFPEEGKILSTDSSGKAKLNGLIPEQKYILQEINATNNYVLNTEPIVFKLVKEENVLQFQKESGEIKGSRVEQVAEGKMPKLTIEVENEPKYELEIVKYKKGTQETIADVIFKLKGEALPEEGAYLTTDERGVVQISGLIPKAEYTLQEVKTNSDFMQDDQVIKFMIIRNEEGNLNIQILEGNVRNASIEDGQELPQAKIEIDNETRYQIEINKQELGTNKTLKDVKFVIKGKGFPDEGGVFTTDKDGKTIITSLEIGEVYTLKESYAKGYYVNQEELTVKVERVEGELKLICEGTNMKETPVLKQEANKVPSVQIVLENEKIPTYTLELTKIAEETSKLLEGAKFEITGKDRDKKEEKEYISAEDGKLTIENLYVNEEYILKEVLEPTGYKLDETPIKFKAVQTDSGWSLVVMEGEFSGTSIVEGNVIKVKKENAPKFKLEKKDGETGKPIQGVKFTIKDLDGNNAKDVAGNEIGVIENIDGEDKRVVTTDENGLITAEIAEGLYEVTEVKPANGYKLPRQVMQYFGINRSQETIRNFEIERSTLVQSGMIVERVIPTDDGGFWAVGSQGKYKRSNGKM